MSRKSEVWKFFKKDEKRFGEATCCKCEMNIGWKSSTTPMINHLKLRHNILISKSVSSENEIENDIPKKKQRIESSNILQFVKKESLNEILSKVAAFDGMTITAMSKSEAIAGYVKQRGYKMPKSPTTISKCINSFYKEKCIELRDKFEKLRIAHRKFAITVDEWTDCSIVRYVNVTAHVLAIDSNIIECYVLGLTEIIKQANAETIKHLVEAKLADFGISLKNDVIASTNDAAAVMKKYGKILGIVNQLCHNHALHLAVMDCFYKPNNYICDEIDTFYDNTEEFVDEDTDEQDEDSIEDQSQYSDNNLEFIDENIMTLDIDFDQIINNLRDVIRMFKKSATKHSILQQNIIKKMGKKVKLKLDIKTRWNSLTVMIRRFLILSECVNKSLVELNFEPISENVIVALENLVDVLAPVETAVIELSKKDANLITAEGVYKFLFAKLQPMQTNIAKKLMIAIKNRMDERRDPILMTLLIYLQSGNVPSSNDHFKYSSKSAVISFAVKIMEQIYPQMFIEEEHIHDSISSSSHADDLIEITSEIGLQKELQNAISSITDQQNCEVRNHKEIDKYNELKKEFRKLDSFKKRSPTLDILYHALITIRPTSTASERVFSTAGSIKTKRRTSLNFETLNSLLFLRYMFLEK